jgi:hypothetical protein
MLHPFLPPVPPLILESSQSTNLLAITVSDRQFKLTTDADSKTPIHKENSQEQRQSPQKETASNTGNLPQLGEALTAKTLSAPTQQEILPSENSSLNVAKNAAALGEPLSIGDRSIQFAQSNDNRVILGEPLSIGYPVQRSAEVSQSIKRERGTGNRGQGTDHQLSLTDSQQSAENLLPTQQGDTATKNSQNSETFQLTQQPIKIQFNSHSKTNESPQPSTIVFKSRSITSQFPTPDPNIPQQPPQPAPTPPNTTPEPQTQPSTAPPQDRRVVEVVADRQEYDEQRRVVTAEGNVVVRFDGAVVDADRLQVNLDNLIAVGEGNVALTRGDQVLRGERFTYNFIQDSGELTAGSGEIFIPTVGQDFTFLPTNITPSGVPARPISDRIRQNQPLTAGSAGGIDIGVGTGSRARNLVGQQQGGQVRRLRFEAAHIDFYPRGWQARDVQITNDPFSPPELVLRADKVTLTRETPLRDRIKTQRQRLVFDQGLSVPIPRDEQVLDRREREVTPGLASIGYDGEDRGGLFVERSFQPISTEQVSWSFTPQFLVQKVVEEGVSNIPGLFGARTSLNATLSPRTTVEGSGRLNSFDLTQVEDNLRASLRLRQLLGDITNPHTLALEYSYRDRLYNGTLGFQTVQSSLGGVITSPVIPLGNGINFSYQGGAQYINARTDRQDLLETIRDNDRISLGRAQASAALNGGILLWQGKPLAPTATEGLRYTPNPVVPYLRAFAGVTGTTSFYTSGDNQNSLFGTIGLEGQLGHFSRSFFDYTAFNVSYSQGLNSGESPFLFDRVVDTKILNVGITQQIYGPFRLGFQTSVNLDTGESRSTDYILEYSRRTYGITLRYNPVLELGGISFRISDFNWTGGTDPFTGVKPVVGGVEQRD